MDSLDDVEVIAFPDAAAWESWLAANHERAAGVWLKMAKKGSGIPSVTDDEVVDIGLCWGWISGQRRSLDGDALPAEVRPPPTEEPVVEGQRGEGGDVVGGGPDA